MAQQFLHRTNQVVTLNIKILICWNTIGGFGTSISSGGTRGRRALSGNRAIIGFRYAGKKPSIPSALMPVQSSQRSMSAR